MDLQDQLKKLFPEHQISNEPEVVEQTPHELFIQKEPLICQYEKRKGKPTTVISGYEGDEDDFKILAKEIKNKFAVGGSFKDGELISKVIFVIKSCSFCKPKDLKPNGLADEINLKLKMNNY